MSSTRSCSGPGRGWWLAGGGPLRSRPRPRAPGRRPRLGRPGPRRRRRVPGGPPRGGERVRDPSPGPRPWWTSSSPPAGGSPIASTRRSGGGSTTSRGRRRLSRALAAVALLLAAALAAGALAFVNERRADRQRARRRGGALAESVGGTPRRPRSRPKSSGGGPRWPASSPSPNGSSTATSISPSFLPSRPATGRDIGQRGALLTALTHNTTAAQAGPGDRRTSRSFAGFLAGPPRIQYDVDGERRRPDRGEWRRRRVRPGRGRAGLRHDDQESRSPRRRRRADRPGRRELGRASRARPRARWRRAVARRRGGHDRRRSGASRTWPSVFFRPGATVRAGAGDGSLTLWDVATRTRSPSRLPPSPLGLAGFAPDGTLVVGEPTAAVFWDIERGEEVRRVELEIPGAVPTQVDLSTDGALLVGADPQGRVDIGISPRGCSAATPRRGRIRRGGSRSGPTSPSILAIGSSGGGVSLYDVDSERVIGEPLFGHGTGTRDVAFSADGRYLASIADDGLVGLWGGNHGSGPSTVVLDPTASNPSYSRMAGEWQSESPVGSRSGTAAAGETWRRCATTRWMAGHQLPAQRRRVQGAGVRAVQGWRSSPTRRPEADLGVVARRLHAEVRKRSTDGQVVATVDHSYGRLRSTDVRTGKPGRVSIADASRPQARRLGPAGLQRRRTLLDVPTNLGVARFRAAGLRPVGSPPLTRTSRACVPCPGTTDLIGAGVGGQVWRWDMNTGELVARGQSRDSSSLTNLSVSPDGSMVAAYHPFSAQLALFDAATCGRSVRRSRRGPLVQPRFTSDGRYLTGNGLFDGLTRWNIDPNAWLSSACLAAGRNLTRAEWWSTSRTSRIARRAPGGRRRTDGRSAAVFAPPHPRGTECP